MADFHRVTIYSNPIFDKHVNVHSPFHPENPERISAILNRLKESNLNELLTFKIPKRYDSYYIKKTHSADYLERIYKTFFNEDNGLIDSDTFFSSETLRASLIAANSGIVAARDILAQETDRAFCCVRPPGHHAEKNNAMGFCFFNNIAVTVNYLLMNQFKRILIIDFDVHHGNGSQEIFYEDNRVLFVSTHQNNIFPFSGSENQTGSADGEGYNINIPLPQYTQYPEMEAAVYQKAARFINNFDPEIVLFSAGFDAHKDDPIGGFSLESEDFYKLTKLYLSVLKNKGIPIISILEGGYHISALSTSVEYHIQALCEKER